MAGKPAKAFLGESRALRVLRIDLRDPAFDPVFEWANQTDPERAMNDAARELLLSAVHADAKDAAVAAVRREAYHETKRYAFGRLATFLAELHAEIEAMLGGAETVGPQAENAIAREA